MRPGFLLAFAVLLILGSASLPQKAISQAADPSSQVKFRGCIYYEHSNWQGRWRTITAGTRRKYVGNSWNDLISSFACNPLCRVVAFQHSEFQGNRAEFASTSYVGDPWNDQISSMVAICRRPW